MGWHPFDLDHKAQQIVLNARQRDHESLNQAFKMRATCAYGLERFWGEHLRLRRVDTNRADFVKETWEEFIEIIGSSKPGIEIPRTHSSAELPEALLTAELKKIWALSHTDQQECLAVLVALCDAIVWWTQRLKIKPSTQRHQPGQNPVEAG